MLDFFVFLCFFPAERDSADLSAVPDSIQIFFDKKNVHKIFVVFINISAIINNSIGSYRLREDTKTVPRVTCQ